MTNPYTLNENTRDECEGALEKALRKQDWLTVKHVAERLIQIEEEASDGEPQCLPECDERHAEDCPAYAAEERRMRREFGLRDDMTPEQVRAQLELVKPSVFNADYLAELDERR